MTQSDLIVLCHFADGGIWTPYIRRISGVSIPRLSKSSIRIVDTSSADGISTSLASGTSTSLASTVFCFETARVDEHEHRTENSRKEKAYTMRYQPLDNSILIVRLFICFVLSVTSSKVFVTAVKTAFPAELSVILFCYHLNCCSLRLGTYQSYRFEFTLLYAYQSGQAFNIHRGVLIYE